MKLSKVAKTPYLFNIVIDRIFSDLVIADGMPRSGSTRLAELIFIVLNYVSNKKVSHRWFFDIDFNCKRRDWTIVKIHSRPTIVFRFAKYSFYSYRNIYDAMISSHIFFGSELSLELADIYIEGYQHAKARESKMFSYEEIVESPDQLMCEIAEEIGFCLSRQECMALLDEESARISEDRANTYSQSLYHVNHRTHSETVSVGFPDSLKNDIQAKYRWWFEEVGYEI